MDKFNASRVLILFVLVLGTGASGTLGYNGTVMSPTNLNCSFTFRTDAKIRECRCINSLLYGIAIISYGYNDEEPARPTCLSKINYNHADKNLNDDDNSECVPMRNEEFSLPTQENIFLIKLVAIGAITDSNLLEVFILNGDQLVWKTSTSLKTQRAEYVFEPKVSGNRLEINVPKHALLCRLGLYRYPDEKPPSTQDNGWSTEQLIGPLLGTFLVVVILISVPVLFLIIKNRKKNQQPKSNRVAYFPTPREPTSATADV